MHSALFIRFASFPSLASYEELLGIDGGPNEFECKIQNELEERNIEPEKIGDASIFMSMLDNIVWTTKGHEENCISN